MEVSVRGDRLVGRDNRTGGRVAGRRARWAVREFILQFLASSLTEGSIYGLMALGLVITLRSTEVLFFGQGTMAMVGGVMMYALFAQAHMPLVISIPCTLMICIIISLLSLRVIVLPFSPGAPLP